MTHTPLVSVIVPNYNHEKYLKKRIDSILNQTYVNFEIILLDDKSTDDSVTVLKSYKNNNNKVSHTVLNTQNSGSTFLQWKKGITLAQGEYIWIAESDDYCEPTLLSTIMNGLVVNNNAAVGFVQSHGVNNKSEIMTKIVETNDENLYHGSNYFMCYMTHGNPIYNASMAVFRKDCFYNVSKEYLNYKMCGDWIFWSEIVLQGDVFVSGKALNYFRNHDGDVSSGYYKMGKVFFEELKVLLYFLSTNKIDKKSYNKAYQFKYNQYRLRRRLFSNEMKKSLNKLFLSDKSQKEQIILFFNYYILVTKVNLKKIMPKRLIYFIKNL